jgi:hypothetical protein
MSGRSPESESFLNNLMLLVQRYLPIGRVKSTRETHKMKQDSTTEPSVKMEPDAQSRGKESPKPTAAVKGGQAMQELSMLRKDVHHLTEQFEKTQGALASLIAESPESANRSRDDLNSLVQNCDRKLTDLLARVDAIEHKLFEPDAAKIEETKIKDLEPFWLEAFAEHSNSLTSQIGTLFQPHDKLVEQCRNDLRSGIADIKQAIEALTPDESGASTDPSQNESAWQELVLGNRLTSNVDLQDRVHELCARILAGDPDYAALAGHLLILQNSPPERRPQLLKDLGEAYYRCFPKTEDVEDPFEQAMASWLEQCCEPAGFQNVIELVHPGDQFDASRHTTIERGGVEIVDVRGWVVLRNRDKVYTKATVLSR